MRENSSCKVLNLRSSPISRFIRPTSACCEGFWNIVRVGVKEKMVALAVANVSSKCSVPVQETALRFQPLAAASRLSCRHGANSQSVLRTWTRRISPQHSSSHQNVSTTTTNLSEETRRDDAVAEDLSPNYDLLLKEKADELRDDLHGTCIFLIGLMDNGKAAIGKTLAKELGYYFFDSNDLVQQAAGGTQVSEDEEGYREAETEVLKQLSAVGRLVVSTGAGTVAKSENWGFLRHGIVVWVDMPLETVANCTKTRQLLAPNCAEDEALVKMSKLYEERKETYRNADAMVSIQAISAQLGVEDPAAISPSRTALEVLNVIGALIKEKQAKKLRF